MLLEEVYAMEAGEDSFAALRESDDRPQLEASAVNGSLFWSS